MFVISNLSRLKKVTLRVSRTWTGFWFLGILSDLWDQRNLSEGAFMWPLVVWAACCLLGAPPHLVPELFDGVLQGQDVAKQRTLQGLPQVSHCLTVGPLLPLGQFGLQTLQSSQHLLALRRGHCRRNAERAHHTEALRQRDSQCWTGERVYLLGHFQTSPLTLRPSFWINLHRGGQTKIPIISLSFGNTKHT